MNLDRLARKIIDHLNDAVIIADHAGRCVAVNPATCRLTGYDEIELLQTPLSELLIPWKASNADELAKKLALLSNGSGVQPDLFELQRKDGALRFICRKVLPIDEHQVHIIQDITPYLEDPSTRPEGEDAGRPVEDILHSFRTIIETSHEAIAVTDTDGRLVYVNPAHERLFGRPRAEALKLNCRDYCAPESIAVLEDVILPGLARGAGWEGEIEAVDAQGRRFPLWKRADTVSGSDGDTLYYFGIMHDITGRKQTERALRRYAEEQTALYAITSVLTDSLLDSKILLETILDVVLPLLNAAAGWIVIPDDAPRIAAWRNISEAALSAETAAVLQDCPLCVGLLDEPNPEPTPQPFDQCPLLETAILSGLKLHSHMGVPLTAGDQVQGILVIAWREPYEYTEADHTLMLTIGRQVGIALHNRQLYREAGQANHLQFLNNLDQTLGATLDSDRVIEVVLEQTTIALKATIGAMFSLALPLEASSTHSVRIFRAQHGWQEHNITGKIALKIEAFLRQCLGADREAVSVHEDALDEFMDYAEVTAEWGSEVLLVPIWQKDQLAIVLALGGRPADQPFTEGDRALAQTLANRAGQAVQNAYLYKVSQTRVEELALVNEIGFALASTLDYSKVLRDALVYIQAVFHADNLSLIQPDPRTREIRFVQTLVGSKLIEIPVRLPPSEGIAGWVLKHRQPALIEDVQHDARWSHQVDQYIEGQECTMMAVPLLTPTNVIGVIELVSNEPGSYTVDKLQTLRAIASILAVALENARLYEELKMVLREREQVQVQLIHSEKIAALGRLVASISHEINNPLQAVQGCLSLTKEEFNSLQRADKIREYLDVVEEEVDRISEIVRRTRDFYRPSQGGMQPTDVHAVLGSVLTLTSKQLQHSNVTVECGWADNPPKIEANPDHLKQVFLNMILNAIDAMPNGGILHIGTSIDQIKIRDKQKLQTVSKQPAVHVTFSDTGTGMSIEVLSHLFEPFFTTKPHGSGLGLAISYGIIESHNGQIMVASQVGRGTTFTILLPVKQP
ncbi:MAG: GAF domain-containing protein [Anaerolineae bacterium]|nr:GAF domain-containing protein [Anaerolineae bacterium]